MSEDYSPRTAPKAEKRTVMVQVNETIVDVSVQGGKQTIRWLAVVVQDRLRRTKNAFDKTAESCIVMGIYNMDGELLDPNQKILEHAEWDNCKWQVTAKTAAKFPADDYGNPIYEDWTAAAYLKSDHTFSWALEMSQWRTKLSTYSPGGDGNGAASAEMEPSDGSMIQIGDRPEAEIAFDLDWGAMKWGWLELPVIGTGKTAVILDRDQEINGVKVALAQRYELILVLFQHYCGSGEIGERYGMSTLEFAHLLRLCGVVVSGDHDMYMVEEAPDMAAAASVNSMSEGKEGDESKQAGGDNASSNDDAKNADAESEGAAVYAEEAMRCFVEATVRSTSPSAAATVDLGILGMGGSISAGDSIAEAKGGSSILLSGGPSMMSTHTDGSVAAKYSGVLLSRAHFATALVEVSMQRKPNATPADALCLFLDGAVFPTWQKMCQSYSLYQEYEEDAVFRHFYHENYSIIKRQFLNYSRGHVIAQSRLEEQRSALRRGAPFIDVDKVVQIFKATLFVGSALSDEEVVGEIINILLRVQLNPKRESHEYREVVFAEFVEMTASVGLLAIDKASSGLSEGKRLRMAFNYIIESSPGHSSAALTNKASKK